MEGRLEQTFCTTDEKRCVDKLHSEMKNSFLIKKFYEKQTMLMHVATLSHLSSRSKIVFKGKFSFSYEVKIITP